MDKTTLHEQLNNRPMAGKVLAKHAFVECSPPGDRTVIEELVLAWTA